MSEHTPTNNTESAALEQKHGMSGSPPSISKEEAKMYYYGLPSQPLLIARTGTVRWESPTGPEAYYRPKMLRIAGKHKIVTVWEGEIAPMVQNVLEARQVNWSSIDIVHIGYADESSGNLVLWIGVGDGSLAYDIAFDAVQECKKVLLSYDIDDIEVEMRLSNIIQLVGPPLLRPAPADDTVTTDVREPFTPSLGIAMSLQDLDWAEEHEGTGSFFLGDGKDPTRLLLVTARHVVFPTSSDNLLYARGSRSEPKRQVLLFSDTSFERRREAIQTKIKLQDITIDLQQRRVKKYGGKKDTDSIRQYNNAENLEKQAVKDKERLEEFHQEILSHWATAYNRVLGHVIFSPPIEITDKSEGFAQDVAVIEIDPSKVDPNTFKGNFIDLGHKFNPGILTIMMYPNHKNSHNFSFPVDRLLPLSGTIEIDELRNPTMYDENGEPCILVLKNGSTTGLTVGRANNIFSFTCKYFGDSSVTSKGWSILPFDEKSGAFSKKGDSGAVVVDGAGRIGGILTGGSGTMETCDISYATPISVIMNTIKSYEPLANVYIKCAEPTD